MKYIVETFSTFREVHIVEAENQEVAEKIAGNSDYNMSKWLGQQIATIYPFSEEHIQRFREEDQYFWDGVKSVNADGYLCYTRPGSDAPVPSDMGEKII